METLGLKPDPKSDYEFWVGDTCFGIWEPEKQGMEFAPSRNAHPALHVDDVEAAKKELEAKGVEFFGDVFDTGVCHMALFKDPDGNDLMLHHRYSRATGVARLGRRRLSGPARRRRLLAGLSGSVRSDAQDAAL